MPNGGYLWVPSLWTFLMCQHFQNVYDEHALSLYKEKKKKPAFLNGKKNSNCTLKLLAWTSLSPSLCSLLKFAGAIKTGMHHILR